MLGELAEVEIKQRVDERGIPIPDWWTDDDDTGDSAMAAFLSMKSPGR